MRDLRIVDTFPALSASLFLPLAISSRDCLEQGVFSHTQNLFLPLAIFRIQLQWMDQANGCRQIADCVWIEKARATRFEGALLPTKWWSWDKNRRIFFRTFSKEYLINTYYTQHWGAIASRIIRTTTLEQELL